MTEFEQEFVENSFAQKHVQKLFDEYGMEYAHLVKAAAVTKAVFAGMSVLGDKHPQAKDELLSMIDALAGSLADAVTIALRPLGIKPQQLAVDTDELMELADKDLSESDKLQGV